MRGALIGADSRVEPPPHAAKRRPAFVWLRNKHLPRRIWEDRDQGSSTSIPQLSSAVLCTHCTILWPPRRCWPAVFARIKSFISTCAACRCHWLLPPPCLTASRPLLTRARRVETGPPSLLATGPKQMPTSWLDSSAADYYWRRIWWCAKPEATVETLHRQVLSSPLGVGGNRCQSVHTEIAAYDRGHAPSSASRRRPMSQHHATASCGDPTHAIVPDSVRLLPSWDCPTVSPP
jgi:hypothetical protein